MKKIEEATKAVTEEKIQKATYSVAEAAKVLGISRTLAYELVYEGEIPSLQLKTRLVVPKIAIEKMLEDAYEKVR